MSTQQMMQAIRVHRYGGPEELKLEQVPRPEPGAGEVLVRVYVTNVLPIEWKVRQGLMQGYFPVAFPYIPGNTFAGVIEQVGPSVTDWKVGQEVFGKSSRGSYAEYTTASQEAIALKPPALAFEEVVPILGGATTAWEALFERGELQPDQRVLILGASGGVGSFAVQLAKWKRAEVVGTTSTVNTEYVRELGADQVVDYTTTTVEQAVRDVDLVVDTVGGQAGEGAWPVIKRGGSFVSIVGMPSQEKAQESGIRALFFSAKPTTTERLQLIARLIDSGQIKATPARAFPLHEANDAQESSQSGHGRGRIVLRVQER